MNRVVAYFLDYLLRLDDGTMGPLEGMAVVVYYPFIQLSLLWYTLYGRTWLLRHDILSSWWDV